jgi:hypothetical protein
MATIVQQKPITQNPLYRLGSDMPKNISVTPQQRMGRVKTAVEQAVEMFNKLLSLKINKVPLPASKMLNYAVAALPGGQMLMGNGQTKISTPAKKINKAKNIDQESLAPMGTGQKTPATISDLLLQIAVPAKQIGAGADKTFTFVNYLNQILRPQMPTAPGLGAPALLPDSQAVGKFYTPSAISNLPPLVKRVEDSFESPLAKYGTFLENTDKIQKDLAQRFLSQFSRGERPAVYGVLGGTGRAPVISNYENRFSLPAPKSATSAVVKAQIPTFSATTIY